MEGFLRWRMRPWARRSLTRRLAILPATFATGRTSTVLITALLGVYGLPRALHDGWRVLLGG